MCRKVESEKGELTSEIGAGSITRNERITGGSPEPYSPFLAAKVFVANGRKEDRSRRNERVSLLGETLNQR